MTEKMTAEASAPLGVLAKSQFLRLCALKLSRNYAGHGYVPCSLNNLVKLVLWRC